MTNGRMQGFYFIAKSSPLPVSEGEAHLTYGIMSDILRGKSSPVPFYLITEISLHRIIRHHVPRCSGI